ncbi:hypothetical protein F2Q69_00009449 [Brassica cretica]|uniref:Reverse transcriptase zinc-binding domain-containing protein n=1 Tax=Brassica cretica TaxID=69181 RepID=A0A8S9NTV1_BRACR|nr:hypothetical protein F2Q69_00009449 [Brassica cretica]
MGPAPERFVNLKVRDLMLSNGSDWNRDLIQQILPQEEAIILSIKSGRSGAPDKLIWLGLSKLVCLPPTGVATGPLAPWILWSLWLARNNRLFINKIATPEEIISRAIAAAHEWLREQCTEPSNTKNTRVLRPSRDTDSSRLQTDAAWRADLQCAGLGWTII